MRVCILLSLLLCTHLYAEKAQSNSTTSQTLPKEISVLPIESANLDKGLSEILANDFRKFLEETGQFQVMSREMMEEILKEQSVQMSGLCAQQSCMVEAGKILGISGIVSVSITELGENHWAASAKLVNVETGKIVSTASERRKGPTFETNQRILKNLASVLAGSPNRDHKEYLKRQKKRAAEQKHKELVESNYWRLQADLLLDYEIHLLQQDPNAPLRKYLNARDELTTAEYPKNKVDPALRILIGYRIGALWLTGGISMQKTRVRKAHFAYRDIIDTTFVTGTSGYDHIGYYTIESAEESSTERFTLHAGLRKDFLATPRFTLSWCFLPEVGFIKYSLNSLSVAEIDYNTTVNDAFESRYTERIVTRSEDRLQGLLFGTDLEISGEWHATERLSIGGGLVLHYTLAPSLEGESSIHLTSESFENPGNLDGAFSDSSYTTNSAFLVGDFWGTGEFVGVGNPDEPFIDPDGNTVDYKPSYKEFAAIRIKFGVSYMF